MEVEWVQIIDPRSHELMYANVKTGDCSWEPPEGVQVKEMGDNQWWELYDAGCNCNYYYNVTTQETVWERPEGTDIIPLARLQAFQEGADSQAPPSPRSPHRLTETIGESSAAEMVSVEHEHVNADTVEHDYMNSDPVADGQAVDGGAGQGYEQTQYDQQQYNDQQYNQEQPDQQQYDPQQYDQQQYDQQQYDQQQYDQQQYDQQQYDQQQQYNQQQQYDDQQQYDQQEAYNQQGHDGQYDHQQQQEDGQHDQQQSNDQQDNTTDASWQQASSTSVPAAPPAPPSAATSAAHPSIEQFDKIRQPKKKLFKKKMTLADMLSWTKEPLSSPMLQTRDKKRRKEALEMFKLIQTYMGDRKSKAIPSKGKDRDQALLSVLLDIVSRSWATPTIRDELFIQLCRQTTNNRDKHSLHAGWEVMCTSLAFFPPSNMFHSYLEGYVSRHSPMKHIGDLKKAPPVDVYALYCSKRLERLRLTGARKGQKKPTFDEVEHARTLPYNPSMFGDSLAEVVEMQKSRFPKKVLPWILTTLSEEVLRLNAQRTEGIFRVPGDVDEVNALKLKVDRFELPKGTNDPHIPASLLKLWFRELLEPIIPESLYDRCISMSTSAQHVLGIVDQVPELNRLVLTYIVRFLQKFARPEVSSLTKMDVNNLAMVWAPNCLRCPYDNPTLIFENTRKEMEFMRTLMTHMDTSSVENLV